MSIRVDNPATLFDWLHKNDVRYVVLRDFDGLSISAGENVQIDDLDLLVEDGAIPDLATQFKTTRSPDGIKCDLYGVRGEHGSDYHGHAHLPEELGERILQQRQLSATGVYVPDDEGYLRSLLYHLSYHKNIQSGFHWDDSSMATNSPHRRTVQGLLQSLDVKLEFTHQAFDAYLRDAGYGVTPERLNAYIQHDFHHHRKSLAHARIADRQPGEMNLFVVRKIAVKKRKDGELLEKIRDQYRVIASKPITWSRRISTRKQMRGGKWRRGGHPYIAVVVFDPSPIPSSEEQRAIHPFVFNARQFIKPQWRDWFVAETGVKATANPIHSTDNEAEAIGHLPLFFDDDEQQRIFRDVDALRTKLPESVT